MKNEITNNYHGIYVQSFDLIQLFCFIVDIVVICNIDL